MKGRTILFIAVLLLSTTAFAQGRGQAPPPSPRAAAQVDFTGYWVSVVSEDWRWRMVTPARGDFASIPFNAEGRRVGLAWDPAKDESAGEQCKAYGAAAIMRRPVGCTSPGRTTIPCASIRMKEHRQGCFISTRSRRHLRSGRGKGIPQRTGKRPREEPARLRRH